MLRSPLFNSEVAQAAEDFALFAEEFGGPGFFQPDTSRFPTPDYDEVVTQLGHLAGSQYIDVPADEDHMSVLGQFPGLRVMAGIALQDHNETVGSYMPGIVLSGHAETHIGYLCAPPDLLENRNELDRRLRESLPADNHPLLYQVYGMHRRGVGEHLYGDSVNFGDIAHAALIAISSDREDIHKTVHQYLDQGLAKSVAQTRALDVLDGSNYRPVREGAMNALSAKRIFIARKHQDPPDGALQAIGVGNVAIGVVWSAVRTKFDLYAQPDIKLNIEAMREQVA